MNFLVSSSRKIERRKGSGVSMGLPEIRACFKTLPNFSLFQVDLLIFSLNSLRAVLMLSWSFFVAGLVKTNWKTNKNYFLPFLNEIFFKLGNILQHRFILFVCCVCFSDNDNRSNYFHNNNAIKNLFDFEDKLVTFNLRQFWLVEASRTFFFFNFFGVRRNKKWKIKTNLQTLLAWWNFLCSINKPFQLSIANKWVAKLTTNGEKISIELLNTHWQPSSIESIDSLVHQQKWHLNIKCFKPMKLTWLALVTFKVKCEIDDGFYPNCFSRLTRVTADASEFWIIKIQSSPSEF